MDVVFKNVRIIDPRSVHHLQQKDIRIKDGIIDSISDNLRLTGKIKILEKENSCISPGWVDVGAYGGEPGFEEREILTKLSRAAISGGYSRVLYMPITNPTIHSKSEVHFLIKKSSDLEIYLHPIGSVSKNASALEMAEILQMHEAGALAFSDGNYGINKSGLLKRALEYLRLIPNSVLIQHSWDPDLAPNMQVHESEETIQLGLRINPSLSEYTAVQRDLSILEYTNSRMLSHKISCQESVQLIKRAKKGNKNLFSSVSIFNLAFRDKDLLNFSTSLKLIPPLRGLQDQKALWQGLKEDTIDLIVSDHTPINAELKDLEFQNASFGAISLETAYSLFNEFGSTSMNHQCMWVQKVAINPREIFNLPTAIVEEGANAELTWFDPTSQWTYSNSKIKSQSKNTPVADQLLKGSSLGVYNKSNFYNFN